MIKSMTGYGYAKRTVDAGTSGTIDITIELKSVNNRYLDCTIRLPRGFGALEDGIKQRVAGAISRGKVDVFVTIDTSRAGDALVRVNRPVADAYMAALKELSELYGLPGIVSATELTRYPDVLSLEKSETDPQTLESDVLSVLDEALTGFTAMRCAEGQNLARDILGRLDTIENLTARCEVLSPKTVADYRARLEARLSEVLAGQDIDPQRILTEAAIFADRIDIGEETVRLRSHVGQLRGMLQSDVPVGRKLDFLVQELNREANTIGSKGNDAEMARIVVDLKAEIERIREQIQNIE
ncbi:MAG TPA: YicC family protein [Papillibacter sp.]|jgi:uncharacterized protein (TIGR00255 family)|nr:YicC family protein [Papillibacter sp.]